MDPLERYLNDHSPQYQDGASDLLLREVAYERLKDAIRYAEMAPGQLLSETRLSKLLGISRTPVREALQMLAQEGLVHITPGRSVTVASHSVKEVLDAVHVRSLLEPELARLAAQSMPESAVAALQQSVSDMEAALADENTARWSKADATFHELLSDSSPNGLLGELIIRMRNRIHYMAGGTPDLNHNRMHSCTAEHRRIAEAIAAKEPYTAEQATRDHIDALRDSLLKRLSYER